MLLSIEEVERIAKLARLELNDEEKNLFQEQLSAVLEYVDRLKQVNIEDVPPTTSAVPLTNVMRDDIIQPSLTVEDALFNADQVSQNQYLIQAVLDDE